jgi:hypothetical protein
MCILLTSTKQFYITHAKEYWTATELELTPIRRETATLVARSDVSEL